MTNKRTRDELSKMVAAHEARIASLEVRLAAIEPKQQAPEETGTDWSNPALVDGYALLASLLGSRRPFGSVG